MTVSVFGTVLFVFTGLFAISGIFLIKKSNDVLNAVAWIIMSILIAFSFDAFICGIVNLIKVPINLYSISVINFLLGGALWFWIMIKKKKQSYFTRVFDIVASVTVIIIGVTCAYIQFGPNLTIHFETSDPAQHFRAAMDILNTQHLSSMNYGHFAISLIIGMLAPFVHLYSYYKLYIIAEILFYVMSGLVFYSLVLRFSDKLFQRVSAIILTIMYMLGYPLNDMIYGFGYLGIGVTITAFILFATYCFTSNQIFRWFAVLTLMLGCYGIIDCYSLFAPVVFLSVFMAISWFYVRQKKLFSLKMVLTQLIVFLIPVIIGAYYSFFAYFGGANQGLTTLITFEGAIFRDLFSNFVIIGPFMVFGVATAVKNKDFDAGFWVFCFLLLFMIGLFVLGLKGYVSSYYYYKNYYLMWLIAFYLGQRGISYLAERSKTAIVSYSVVWGLIGVMAVSRIEKKINETNVIFDPFVKSEAYLYIYDFNWAHMSDNSGSYSSNPLSLYKYIVENCHLDSNPVFLFDDWESTYWFEAITNQRIAEFYNWRIGAENYVNAVKQKCKYIVVNPNANISKECLNFLNTLEKVYETDYGYVALVK